MKATLLRRIRWGLALALSALLLLPAPNSRVAADPPPESGLVCTFGTIFTLTATAGYVTTPDGNTIHMWSYAPGSGPFQLPGPNLCVNEGDMVTVNLVNTLPDPVSIIFPGQAGVTASGDADGLFTKEANATSGTASYTFTASEPGTYIYESGTNMEKQVQMGLYGALVVRPMGAADHAYNDPSGGQSSKFDLTTEYVMLLSEVDPDLHQAVELGQAYDYTTYHPRYWMINGRSFPDTIAPNDAPWLPTQPYSALVHIRAISHAAYDAAGPGHAPVPANGPALVRYLNVGALNHPFHPHGNHGRVIARDGRLLASGTADLSYEKFLVLVGSGQTWDATYTFADAEGWTPSNPAPVIERQLQNLLFKADETWYSGSPYLGYTDDLPVGVTTHNQCGEFYMVWHSHALNEFANFDAGFGGMGTLERIDPPGGC